MQLCPAGKTVYPEELYGDLLVLYNGNRTEWSPVRSVIMRVINKIGRQRSGSPFS